MEADEIALFIKNSIKEYSLDEIKEYLFKKEVTQTMFDNAVNMGIGTSVKFLQKALNILNRNGSLYSDISIDGGFGTNTMNALNSYLSQDKPIHLLKLINILQGCRYINIVDNKPSQERFIRGWMKRVEVCDKCQTM